MSAVYTLEIYSTSPLDARQQRALAIVRSDKAKRIRHVSGSRWLVPSQTNPSGGYVVDAEQRTCSCPDHEDRGVACKHIWAIVYLRAEITLPDGATVVTEQRVTYSQPDWSAYHRAQCDEKHRVQLLLRGLCDGIAQPAQTNGRPRLRLADVVYGATMKVYTGMSGRRATTDEKFGGEKRCQRWIKLHAQVGTATHVIASVGATESTVGDAVMLEPSSSRRWNAGSPSTSSLRTRRT
jgi:hypothetical protein